MTQRVDRNAAKQALLSVTNKIRAAKPNKTAEIRELKAQRRTERVAEILEQLTKGETGSSQRFNYRFALQRAATALKNGATPVQLRACKALQEAAPWADLAEPVALFAEAKGVDPQLMLASFLALAGRGVATVTVTEAKTTRRRTK